MLFPSAVISGAGGSCLQRLHCPVSRAGIEEQTAMFACASELPKHPASLG